MKRKYLSLLLCVLMMTALLPALNTTAEAYSQRTTPPPTSSPYYYNYSYNPFYTSGLVTQCTWYAWGRAYEITGTRPILSTNNAKDWFVYNKNNNIYSYSENYYAAREGAIICHGGSGTGHVGIVESVNADGSPNKVSEGGVLPPWGTAFNYADGYYGAQLRFAYGTTKYSSDFQGYIYLTPATPPAANVDRGQDGVYFTGESPLISLNTSYFDSVILRIYRTPAGGSTYLYWEGQLYTNQHKMTLWEPGYYACSFEIRRSTGSISSESVGWIVKDKIPPTINASVNGYEVDISWNDVGASSYYIYVQNLETDVIPYGDNIGKNFTCHLALSKGKWKVFVTAVYGENNMISNFMEFKIGSEVLSFTKNNVTTDAIKLLRWQGMDAASTGEPRNRGYDPTQTSDTVEIRLNGAPMAYSTANLAKAKELLRGVKYESLTHSGAVSQRVAEQADGSLTVGDKLKISFGSSGGNITATVTALKPVAMRLTMADGNECLIATPGDVNLDGSMDANDWTTIMRWTLQASSRYDVTEYPNFTLNGRSFDLWALLADMTGTAAGGSRGDRVDANDWTTIMYLTLQAWKK